MRLCYDHGINGDDAVLAVLTPQKKHAGGRKPKFTKDVRKRFLARMELGDPPQLAAQNVGVSHRTVQRHLAKNPGFRRKMTEAEQRPIAIVESAMFRMAQEQFAAGVFYLANRASDRWKRDPDKSILAAQINVGGVPVEWSVQDARGRLHEMVDELEAKRREHAEQEAIDAPSREINDG